MGFERIFVDRPHGTCFLANQTFITVLVDPSFKDTQGGDETEQSAQRAEITAPKPRREAIESNDSSEDQHCDDGHVVDRLRIVEVRERDPSQPSKKRTEQIQAEIYQGDDDRVDHEGVDPREKGYRIHEINRRKPCHRSADEDEEKKILHLPEG